MSALAMKCGRDNTTLGKILTGRAYFVRLIDLVRIAEELHMTLDALKERIERARVLDRERVQLQAERMLRGNRDRWGQWSRADTHPRTDSKPSKSKPSLPGETDSA